MQHGSSQSPDWGVPPCISKEATHTEGENMTLHVPDWQWNVWKVNPKTGERLKWLGTVMDPKTGFEWLKRQGKKRDHFRINNVPPPTSRMRTPEYEVIATTPSKRERGEDLDPKVIPGKYEWGGKAEAKKTRRTKYRTDDRDLIITDPKGKERRIPKALADQRTVAEVEMQRHAAELLEQHKADEAADLAQENEDH